MSTPSTLTIRIAVPSDLPALTTIYNQAILSHQTADTLPFEVSQRQAWFDAHLDPQFPLYTALLDNQIVGYGTLSKYRGGRPALKYVVETSYYLHQSYQGKGIGTQLLQFLLAKAKELGFKNAYALLLDKNVTSVGLLKKLGFQQWGHLPNIAEIDGEICGQFIFGKPL